MFHRWFLIALLLLSGILCFHSAGFAQSAYPVFGPHVYGRTAGAPDIFNDSFPACNIGATYKLVVTNGEGGLNKILSASININEQEVVKQSEFNNRVESIEKTVTLQPENTVNVRLSSEPGGFITVNVYCVSGCLQLKTTSPANESTIDRAGAVILGNIYNATGEVGVTLQSSGADHQISEVAHVQGGSFAGSMPLRVGLNTVTATATDACGYKTTDTLVINKQTAEERIRLRATPSVGIPSSTTGVLSVTLESEIHMTAPVASYAWDFNGDGTPEASGAGLASVTAQYQQPGLYFPTVTVTDSNGATFAETTIVNVLSIESVNALLTGKWSAMKDALVNENIDRALRNFTGGQTSKYKPVFEALKGQLPVIFSAEEAFNIVAVDENRIEYENIVVEDGKAYSYPVIFVKDQDGLWKIKQF